VAWEVCAVRAERAAAAKEGRAPRVLELLQRWGYDVDQTADGRAIAG